jgi:hypothetical protein
MAVWQKRPGSWPKDLLFALQCCCNFDFFEHMRLGGFSISTMQSSSALLDFHLFPKMKKHLRVQHFHSSEYVQNDVKNWLRGQDTFLCMKDLTNWYVTMIHIYTDFLAVWRSKANMRLYLSPISYSVCCYFIAVKHRKPYLLNYLCTYAAFLSGVMSIVAELRS